MKISDYKQMKAYMLKPNRLFISKKNIIGGDIKSPQIEQREMFNQGSSLDNAVRTIDPVQDSGNKIEEVLKAYGRYQGNRKRWPYKF